MNVHCRGVTHGRPHRRGPGLTIGPAASPPAPDDRRRVVPSYGRTGVMPDAGPCWSTASMRLRQRISISHVTERVAFVGEMGSGFALPMLCSRSTPSPVFDSNVSGSRRIYLSERDDELKRRSRSGSPFSRVVQPQPSRRFGPVDNSATSLLMS